MSKIEHLASMGNVVSVDFGIFSAAHANQDTSRLLKNVASAAKTYPKGTRGARGGKSGVYVGIHEHLEVSRNEVLASAVVFQQPS